jgi:DedD protein
MDAALKQRLVGAAVLVALAVIFLPMLVDGPAPEGGTAAVPLDLPRAPDRNFETRELPIAPAAGVTPTPGPAVTPPVTSDSIDDPDHVVSVDADSTPRVDALPEDLAPAGTEDAVATAPASSTSDPQLAVPAATEPATPPPAVAPVPALPRTAAAGNYVVNLGSYSDAANARALVASLKSSGLAAYTDEVNVNGKRAQRVRLGPFAQRGEAEAARLAATRARTDLAATVVALDGEESATAAAPARAPVAAGFAVQIGALKSEADANALRERARGAGFVTFVERVQTGGGPLWRVRIGPELQRTSADRIKAQVLQKMQIEAMVVSHP